MIGYGYPTTRIRHVAELIADSGALISNDKNIRVPESYLVERLRTSSPSRSNDFYALKLFAKDINCEHGFTDRYGYIENLTRRRPCGLACIRRGAL